MQSQSYTKPFCNVCFKDKQPANIYKSHSPQTSNNVITCPIILSSKCSYCHEKGHWKSHCQKLLKKKIKKNVKKIEHLFENIENDFPQLPLTEQNVKKLNNLSKKIIPLIDEKEEENTINKRKINESQSGLLHMPIKKIHNWADASDSDDESI